MKIKLKCLKCGHEWETKSKLKMVTCPSCQLKVKLNKGSIKQDDRKDELARS